MTNDQGLADGLTDSHPTSLRARPKVVWVVWVSWALAVLLVLTSLIAVVMVAALGLLPAHWLAPAIVVVAAAVLAVALGLFLTKAPVKRLRFTVLAALSVVGIVGAGFAINLAGTVNSFFNKTAPGLELRAYSVIALKSHDTDPQSLTGQILGELVDGTDRTAVESHLVEKFQSTFATCADAGQLAAQLTGGRFPAAVLDSNLVQAYEEADAAFYESIQVIYSFDVEMVSEPPLQAAPSGSPGVRSDDSFVVYISGIDTSGPISRTSRSDVNILMVVNPATSKVLLVNTPRDYYVQLRGTTGVKDKLTHAGIYGIQKSIGTLEDLYGIAIDYYVRVNFSSLIEIVDLVGGIDVDSPEAFKSSSSDLSFVKGINHLDGEAALVFSRERHAFASGDRMRGKNQQLVISALIDQATQRSNLLRYDSLLNAISDAVEMSIPQHRFAQLVKRQLDSGTSWQVESISVDGTGSSQPTYSMGSMKLYVMIPDQATIDAAKQAIEATLQGE
jgi:LCP family protein required for cell wall assembly